MKVKRGGKMKKRIILLIVLIMIVSVYGYSLYVMPSSGPYTPGQSLRFYANDTGYDIYTGTITFGDGSSFTGNQLYTNGVAHTYNSGGTYTVVLTDSFGILAPESMTITIDYASYITISPNPPHAGEIVTFQAHEFSMPNYIYWDFGDGTTISSARSRGGISAGSTVTHIYTSDGSYFVKAYDGGDTSSTPIMKKVTVLPAQRSIQFSPQSPLEYHPVYFTASGFTTSQIDWNFGDGTILTQSSKYQTHRYKSKGSYTVSAKDSSVSHDPVTTFVTVLPDNRFLEASKPEAKPDEAIVFNAINFVGDLVLWDFGDGTVISAGHQVEHVFSRGGVYRVTAVDENGEGEKKYEVVIRILGATDEVNLEIAEIRLDNGKYYKVIAKNSKDIKAVLKMKLRGTGIISGYWTLDGVPFEFINEVAVQGELKKIYTKDIPGLPTIDPGIHRISLKLTRPSTELIFPTLKYYVLPYENRVEIISPPDGFVAKEKEIPEFTWKEPAGGVKYKIAFANYLYKFIYNKEKINWIDTALDRKFKPGNELWKGIKRNSWSYWKVQALDSNGAVIAESDINEIKVVIATAEISINSAEDLNGKAVKISQNGINSGSDAILIKGSIKYKGHSKYLVLRVYLDDQMTDQLLFRDVKKDEVRSFETSIPNRGKGKVVFRVLKTSSPSVVIGIRGLNLIKKK